VDINLVKQVLLALFTDYRLWIAAGGALFFWLIASLAADTSEGVTLPKVSKGNAKKPGGLRMPKFPKLPKLKLKKKKDAPSASDQDGEDEEAEVSEKK
jgi:hypothetical protein